MPLVNKRRAETQASTPQRSVRQRRDGDSDVSDAASGYDDNSENGDGDVSSSLQDQMVKKLVRLALASEYTRQPLRRADITAKVLAPNSTRGFRTVFALAQTQLQNVFGMTMTELPGKEKVTISQKRAAQKASSGNSQNASSSSRAYILTSTLPAPHRNPVVLQPPKIPSVNAEAGYTGLYSLVVSLILLSEGGRISEGKLERYLKRCNADEYVLGGEKTENVLKRMERQGYIVKIKDREPSGEETVDWVVGPRGKVEVGERGAAGLVKAVYGKRDTELEELENQLEKSLGLGTFKRKTRKAGGEGAERGEEEGKDGDGGNGGAEEEGADGDGDGDPGPSRRGAVNGSRGRGPGGRGRVSKAAQPRRSTRRSSGFVDDEAEGDEDEEEEVEDEDDDEDDNEDDDG